MLLTSELFTGKETPSFIKKIQANFDIEALSQTSMELPDVREVGYNSIRNCLVPFVEMPTTYFSKRWNTNIADGAAAQPVNHPWPYDTSSKAVWNGTVARELRKERGKGVLRMKENVKMYQDDFKRTGRAAMAGVRRGVHSAWTCCFCWGHIVDRQICEGCEHERCEVCL